MPLSAFRSSLHFLLTSRMQTKICEPNNFKFEILGHLPKTAQMVFSAQYLLEFRYMLARDNVCVCAARILRIILK